MDDALRTACRLAEKAVRKFPVYLHCENADQASQLSNEMWSFRDDAFIPHRVHSITADDQASDSQEQVVIGFESPPSSMHAVMINLSPNTVPTFARFERLLEVVPAEHEARQASRTKYRFYKDRGYPLNTYNI